MISSGIFDRGKSLRLVTEILRDRKEHIWPTSQGEAKVEADVLKPTLSRAPLYKGEFSFLDNQPGPLSPQPTFGLPNSGASLVFRAASPLVRGG
jgi:hypothetical protein